MDDSISRQAAIEVIENELDKIDHVPQWVFDRLTNKLRELPSAERKKGEWIRLDEYPNDVSVKCSECGVTLEDWMLGAFYNYCPNCGAEMRGEEDDR